MTDERTGTSPIPRRQWLALAGGSVPFALAGCLGDDGPDDDADNGDADTAPPGDDPDDDDDESGDDDTGDDDSGLDGSATLADPRVGETPDEASIRLGDDRLVSVAATNEADAATEIDIQLAVVPTDDGEAVHTDSQTVGLAPDDDERVTFGAVTPDLDAGSYEIVFETATDEARLGLDVSDSIEVDIEVYTQTVARGDLADSGTVTVTAAEGDTEYAQTTFTDGDQPTVEVPFDEDASYTVSVTGVHDGAYPDIDHTFSLGVLAGSDDPRLELEALGYETQGADSMRFTSYMYVEDGGPGGGPYEYVFYGDYGPGAPFGNYHAYYIGGSQGGPPHLTPEDDPFEYGADLHALEDELGTTVPAHSMTVETGDFEYERYFYAGTREQWEPGTADSAFGETRGTSSIAITGLASWSGSDQASDQIYTGVSQVRDMDVDTFNIPRIDATVYVDRDTGYTVRCVLRSLNGDNSHEIVEFFAHDNLNSINWELIKNRSEHETGENPDGEELNELPWERHDID